MSVEQAKMESWTQLTVKPVMRNSQTQLSYSNAYSVKKQKIQKKPPQVKIMNTKYYATNKVVTEIFKNRLNLLYLPAN